MNKYPFKINTISFNNQYLLIIRKFAIQLFALIVSSYLIIIMFGFLNNSNSDSFKYFIDPSSIIDLEESNQASTRIVIIIESIIGICLTGGIISIITSLVLEITEQKRLINIYFLIKRSFNFQSKINTRTLIKKLGIIANSRNFYLHELEVSLDIERSDITKVISSNSDLRLKVQKQDEKILIEEFPGNTSYGSLIFRESNYSGIVIVSTQNASDNGIGHFTRTIADCLNAHYISNEYFSSGSLLEEKQINFATNELYNKTDNLGKDPLSLFISDLESIISYASLVVYIGTANSSRISDIQVLFGGKKGDAFLVENPTYKDSLKIESFVNVLMKESEGKQLVVNTHLESGNTNNNHLSNVLSKKYSKQTINLQINTRVLWDNDDVYYSSIIKIANAITEELL
jgi:hypothetical protein